MANNSWATSKLRLIFGIDLRALGTFRIAMGAMLLGDLAFRAIDLEAHYTDVGLLPRAALIDLGLEPANICLHLITGSPVGIAIMFFLSGIFHVCLMIGFRTRLACFLSWMLLTSVQTRNPLLLQGGDILLRVLLFWSMFLPLGARYSLDALRREASPKGSVLSMASLALLLQVAIMYWSTALLKSGREWIPDGSAVYYALHIEQFAKPLGIWLRQFGSLLRWLTFSVWYFEMYGPFLFFVPFGFSFFRSVVVLGFLGLHVGLALCMELYHFPYVNMISLIPFLPPGFWDWMESKLGARDYSFVREEFVRRYFPRWLGEGVVGFLLIYVITWNLGNLPGSKIVEPSSLVWIAQVTRIDQLWDMFAPAPLTDDGWFVMPGKLINGTAINLLNDKEGPIDWNQPPLVASTFRNDRWRSYLMNIWLVDNSAYRPYYANYLCRRWNDTHTGTRSLAEFKIVFMEKKVLPAYRQSVPNEVVLWEQSCFAAPPDSLISR